MKTTDLQYVTQEKLKYKEQKENFPPHVLNWEAFNQKYVFEVNLQVIPVLWFVSLSRLRAHRWDIFLDEAGLLD